MSSAVRHEEAQAKCVIHSGMVEIMVHVNEDTFLHKDGSFVISLVGEDSILSFKKWINHCLDEALTT